MPSKAQKAVDDMFAVEELVHEIKENLRLKAPPANTVLHHRSLRRPSPYSVPSRSYVATPRSGLIHGDDHTSGGHYGDTSNSSGVDGGGPGGVVGSGGGAATTTTVSAKVHCHPHPRHDRHRNRKATEDIDDPYEMLQSLLKNNSLVKEAVRRLQLNLSPKQRYFYESDEESSRSPMMRMCQLEL